MIKADLISMLSGIDSDSRGALQTPKLIAAIKAVNAELKRLGLGLDHLSPKPSLILNAFRLCPIGRTKIVLLGQDPYVLPSQAMGLSFSVPRGVKIPPSLQAMYSALHKVGLIETIPIHGDLTSWAEQGILMLNTTLTTAQTPNAHENIWASYTKEIIAKLAAIKRPLIFILLGLKAQKHIPSIGNTHHILKWGHPSPRNPANMYGGPTSFVNCDVFAKANDILTSQGLAPIDWNSVNHAQIIEGSAREPVFALPPTIYPKVVAIAAHSTVIANNHTVSPVAECFSDETEDDTIAPYVEPKSEYLLDGKVNTKTILWIFTDGASRRNGKSNCTASWAYQIVNDNFASADSGIVEQKNIPGVRYQTSNNRGELTAIFKALTYLRDNIAAKALADVHAVNIVSDSEYSIKSISIWAFSWVAKGTTADKKNLDIILPASDIYAALKSRFAMNVIHIRSHQAEPQSQIDKFMWEYNDKADKMCGAAFLSNVQ